MEKTRLYINGEWIRPDTYTELYNPYDQSVIAEIAQANEKQVEDAIAAAHSAFKTWKQTKVHERSAVLHQIADAMTVKKQHLAEVMTLEAGKRIQDSLSEVQASIDNFHWYAEEIKRNNSEIIPSKTDSTQVVIQEPLGVVGLITPWNFPLNLVTRKLAPALAAGNTVVLKPSSQTPLCSYELFKILEEADLPRGSVNLITGSSSMVSKVFSRRIEVRKISFTGSTEVGIKVYESGAKTIKKLSLELGGNAPYIVFDDADVADASKKLMEAKKRNMGQVCTSPNRVFVHKNIKEAFVKEVVAHAEALRYGDPLDETTDVGPLIRQKAVETVRDLVEEAVAHGATLHTSKAFGEDTAVCPFVVLSGVTDAMDIYQKEIFGPVISIIEFTDEDEVLAKANETRYGLASYVFTQDTQRIRKFAHGLEFGLVGINEITVSTTETPFGGIKMSGFGRENGEYGLQEYLEYKFINVGV